nr:hypothetical protein [Mesorhizobium escarrei]
MIRAAGQQCRFDPVAHRTEGNPVEEGVDLWEKRPLDEPPRRQYDPPVIVTDRNEVAHRDTKRRDRADDGCSIVVIDDVSQVLRQLSARKAVLDE